jgi:hypothetical protein
MERAWLAIAMAGHWIIREITSAAMEARLNRRLRMRWVIGSCFAVVHPFSTEHGAP